MTTEQQTLRELVERVERASGPDREVDALIAPLQGLRVVDEGHPLGRVCYDRSGYAMSLPRYTTSLDAAMTLVPEGWCFRISANPSSAYVTIVDPAYIDELDEERMHSCGGRTPTIALTAAALRALSLSKGEAESNHSATAQGEG